MGSPEFGVRMDKIPVYCPVYLVGPTAVGKTAVSLALAPRLNAEIVVADSMQVYRGLDMGTAKPTAEERSQVQHHLLDVVDPGTPFDAHQYLTLAQEAFPAIQKRSKNILVVGGTGLYVKALVDGLFKGPMRNDVVRAHFEEETQSLGLPSLYERLKKIDPKAALKIDPQNKRRIIRALEVYELTGLPISHFQIQWDTPQKEACLIGLYRERSDLYKRIDHRVEIMFTSGLVDEVQTLLSMGLEKHDVVMQAIGYKEVIYYLRRKCTLEEAKESVKRATRHFAKRQMTWFRKDSRIRWVSIEETEEPALTSSHVLDIANAALARLG